MQQTENNTLAPRQHIAKFALFLSVVAVIITALYSMANRAQPKSAMVVITEPRPTNTPTVTVTPTLASLPSIAEGALPTARTKSPATATHGATSPTAATPTVIASSPQLPTANPTAAVAVSITPVPILGDVAGNWQGDGTGSTIYQPPAGDSDTASLGRISTWRGEAAAQALAAGYGVDITASLQSAGEDAGLAIGDAGNYLLIRLRPDGIDRTAVLLDRWQNSTFSPAAALTVTMPLSYIGQRHQFELHIAADVQSILTVSIDRKTVTTMTLDLPLAQSQLWLYAGGAGCKFSDINISMN